MNHLVLADTVKQVVNLNDILNALVYTGLGVMVFGAAFLIMIMVMPFSVRKEIEEDQNTALGIIMGSVVIGLALIVAAAVHGG
ncbi:MAG: DUF350 domain-containing protein [Planctomycetes bacterium]|nr:DUF350 domain-containing protein [Planctomycetota bacterium]